MIISRGVKIPACLLSILASGICFAYEATHSQFCSWLSIRCWWKCLLRSQLRVRLQNLTRSYYGPGQRIKLRLNIWINRCLQQSHKNIYLLDFHCPLLIQVRTFAPRFYERSSSIKNIRFALQLPVWTKFQKGFLSWRHFIPLFLIETRFGRFKPTGQK